MIYCDILYKLSFSEQRKNMNTWYEQEKDIKATPSNLKKSLDLPRALEPQLCLSFPLGNKRQTKTNNKKLQSPGCIAW